MGGDAELLPRAGRDERLLVRFDRRVTLTVDADLVTLVDRPR